KPAPQCSRRQARQQQNQETHTKGERHTPFPPEMLRRKSRRDLMTLPPRFSTLIRGTWRSLRSHRAGTAVRHSRAKGAHRLQPEHDKGEKARARSCPYRRSNDHIVFSARGVKRGTAWTEQRQCRPRSNAGCGSRRQRPEKDVAAVARAGGGCLLGCRVRGV